MNNEELDELGDRLWTKLEERIRSGQKHGRQDQGTGSVSLGKIIARHRNEAGYSARQLSEMVGRDHSYISRLERGERGMSVQTLAGIYVALGSHAVIDYLLGILNKEALDAGIDPYGLLGGPPEAPSQPPNEA